MHALHTCALSNQPCGQLVGRTHIHICYAKPASQQASNEQRQQQCARKKAPTPGQTSSREKQYMSKLSESRPSKLRNAKTDSNRFTTSPHGLQSSTERAHRMPSLTLTNEPGQTNRDSSRCSVKVRKAEQNLSQSANSWII